MFIGGMSLGTLAGVGAAAYYYGGDKCMFSKSSNCVGKTPLNLDAVIKKFGVELDDEKKRELEKSMESMNMKIFEENGGYRITIKKLGKVSVDGNLLLTKSKS